jgi:hypothetical protein
MNFKKYIAPSLVGVTALLGSLPAMATIATASLPTDVDTALKAVGFSGLTVWVIGILGLVGAVTAAFAGARLIKRGGNAI